MSDKRLILAVPSDDLPASFENGFNALTDSNVMAILEDADTWFGPRNTLEDFDAYRQIIPYVIAVHDGKVVGYIRQPKSGEARLHMKVSIGLGGHIDLPDAKFDGDNQFDVERTIHGAAARELFEELGLDEVPPVTLAGMIVMNDTEVDRVHLGVVGVVHLKEVPAGSEETGAISMFAPAELLQLPDMGYELENWTKILVPHLPVLIAMAPLYGLGG